jgi:hypothetical protein
VEAELLELRGQLEREALLLDEPAELPEDGLLLARHGPEGSGVDDVGALGEQPQAGHRPHHDQLDGALLDVGGDGRGGQRADRGELHGDPEGMHQAGAEQPGVGGERDVAAGAAERLERVRHRQALAGPEDGLGGHGGGHHHDQRLEGEQPDGQHGQHPSAAVQGQPRQRQPPAHADLPPTVPASASA